MRVRIGKFALDNPHNMADNSPMSTTREATFLKRLSELQQDAGMTDADLARAMGVDQSLISRVKRSDPPTFGIKFALGACDRFPELRFLLFPDVPILTSDVPVLTDGEGAA